MTIGALEWKHWATRATWAPPPPLAQDLGHHISHTDIGETDSKVKPTFSQSKFSLTQATCKFNVKLKVQLFNSSLSAILQIPENFGIDVINMVGQGYDGAAAMSGKNKKRQHRSWHTAKCNML